MTTRVIALDLDGTLLTSKKTILPASLEALARAREAGYQVIVVTGRHHVAIHPFYQALALDTPAICCNGTYLYDYHAKKVLAADPMSVEHAVSLTAMLAEQQIHGLAYVDDAMLYEQPTGHVIRTRNWAQALPEDQRRSSARSTRWRRRSARRWASSANGRGTTRWISLAPATAKANAWRSGSLTRGCRCRMWWPSAITTTI